ncbi:hypothetical protein SADO_02190 [Salinisphaera dokdonensis CL-ES53]|uniref:DUF4442 domain-containing protein n=1 Tax=Salinisphaera dokdonensis CL-ES53 TaxID=1304272 RepID=A0ABV2AWL0_9GAMM
MAGTNNRVLKLWQSMAGKPRGKWLFTRMICLRAPYFGSIRPKFEALEPGHAQVSMRKRRAVHNHIGTVHAIAMCNMAELAGGVLTDVTVPPSHRWIPKGMTVEYLAKAETDLLATASAGDVPNADGGEDYPVQVDVTDTHGKTVFRAVITMWVTPKQKRA